MPSTPAISRFMLPSCRHLGEETGETVECPPCRGRTRLKTFACAVHVKCTQGKKVTGMASCEGCPDYNRELTPITTDVDLIVCIAGDEKGLRLYVPLFLDSLRQHCSLANVNVFIVLRECNMVPSDVYKVVKDSGFQILICPLPTYVGSCREDTSRVCDWMVENCGSSPWFVITHFDVQFKGDYIRWLRNHVGDVDMIGTHHDGIVAMSRSSYSQCQVGFAGVDNFSVHRNGNNDLYLVPGWHKVRTHDLGPCLCLDVGELLSLRVATLKMRHLWLNTCDHHEDMASGVCLFTHYRNGSGHS